MSSSDQQEFWGWALQQYAVSDIQSLLLRLQDEHGFIVLELMLAAWLAHRGHPYDAVHREPVIAAIRPWEVSVIRPLRTQRRDWRGDEGASLLRERLQKLELQAEESLAELMFDALPAIEVGTSSLSTWENFREFLDESPGAEPLLQDVAKAFDAR